MDEGILEVDDIAGDRVVELRGVGELHGVGLMTCEGEVIVQGDEGPVCGVAQVVDCHGVTVGHQEKEEEEEEQKEVEREGETLKERCTWMACGWNEKTSASGLEPCGVMNESDEDTKRQRAGVLNSACCACPCASRHSCYCPLWSHRC